MTISLAEDDRLSRYVTPQYAAGFLGVEVATIRRYIAAGILPAVRVGVRTPGSLRDTRPIRIRLDALSAVLTPVGGGAA